MPIRSVVLLVVAAFASVLAAPATPAREGDSGLLFLNRFDGSRQANIAGGSAIPLADRAGQAPTGVADEAVALTEGAWLAFESEGNFNAAQGTVAFWFKPRWSNADPGSHCFFHIPFGDGEQNAFLLSKGFFERHGGAGNTYFLLPTGDRAYTGLAFVQDRWCHVAVTWQTGQAPLLYFNGARPPVLKGNKKIQPIRGKPTGAMVLGRDGEDGERWADGTMDEFTVYNRALTDAEILALYRRHVSEQADELAEADHSKRLAELAQAQPVKRDDDGRAVEFRGMFYHVSAGPAGNMAEMAERCRRAGFNALIASVWEGRGAMWKCKVPNTRCVSGKIDRVRAGIEEAHRRDMKFLACLNVTMACTDTPASMLVTGADGKPLIIKDKQGKPSGGWGSVFRPTFRAYMCAIVRDLLAQYAGIDGIMWDFVRARPDFARQNTEAYRKYFDRDYETDLTKNIVAGKLPWQAVEWQESHLLRFIAELRQAVREVRRDMPVFVFGPSYWHTSDARLIGGGQGRNMIKMLNYSLVDYACLSYPSLRGQLSGFEYLRDRLVAPHRIVGHLGNWRNYRPGEKRGRYSVTSSDLDELCAQVGALRRQWRLSHFTFYFYRGMTDEQMKRLGGTVFKAPAVWPE